MMYMVEPCAACSVSLIKENLSEKGLNLNLKFEADPSKSFKASHN